MQILWLWLQQQVAEKEEYLINCPVPNLPREMLLLVWWGLTDVYLIFVHYYSNILEIFKILFKSFKKQHKMFDKVTLFYNIQNNWDSDMKQEPTVCLTFSWKFDFSDCKNSTCFPGRNRTKYFLYWLHRT